MDGSQFRYDVFISYSHTDRAWVQDWLLPQLEAAGLRVCIDERDFDLGVASITNMDRAVEQSRHTLLVLTQAWVAGDWTRFEALLAQTHDPAGLRQRLLPLLLQPCQPPRHIGILTYADFTDPQRHTAQLQRVVETIQGKRRLADLGPALRTLGAPRSAQDDRNRAAMIAKVRQSWIVGVLDRSIAKDARIVLGLESRPDAVIDPIDLLVQRPDQAPQPIPAGTPIIDIYDYFNGALLILGAPGAGKTTLLLELARDLLGRAEHDSQHPIPVVFPLSTWAERRLPLEQWLIDELNKRYDIPRKLAQPWIENNEILPLLDGLDEVAREHRDACTESINRYRQNHGLLPLVVCSRVADYDALAIKLRLSGAIRAQPLSRDQVRTYLRAVGIQAIPRSDSPLWELLDTPLMLSVAALAYAGQSLEALAAADPANARDQLFAAYIRRMFERNTLQRPFSDVETQRYLAYLAWQMQQHNQTSLYLEQMQPTWLPRSQRWLVHWGSGLGGSLLTGLIVGLVFGSLVGLRSALVMGLIFGVIGGLGSGVVGVATRIETVAGVHMSWSVLRAELPRAVVFGLCGGLLFGFSGDLAFGPMFGLVVGLGSGFLIGAGGALGTMFAHVVIKERMQPNQGIVHAGRSGLIFGVVVGVAIGLTFGLAFSLVSGLGFGAALGIASGLVFGLVCGLYVGGRAYLQHYLLRLLLICNGSIPRRLVPFLDYATQRIFLRRIDGGYLFIHLMLREHFAGQYEQEQAGWPGATR